MAGGYTMSLPIEDKNYVLQRDMFASLVTLLGGRAAEKIILDDISTGASNDIQRATQAVSYTHLESIIQLSERENCLQKNGCVLPPRQMCFLEAISISMILPVLRYKRSKQGFVE